MVGGAAIKGVSKLLKRRAKIGGARSAIKATKKKPTPRYRTDSKTGEKFLNRRAKIAGVKGLEEYLKKSTRDTGIAILGGTLGGAGIGYKFAKSKEAKAKAKKDDLKKAVDKHREADKKKKEKRKDNYGGK